MQLSQHKWTVEHESRVHPFEDFARAIHYADGLVKNSRVVKIIQLERRKILMSPHNFNRTGAVLPIEYDSIEAPYFEQD